MHTRLPSGGSVMKRFTPAVTPFLAFLCAFVAPAPAGDVHGEVPWGESVDGVQVRLRPDKVQWKAGETPSLRAEVRNDGKTTFFLAKLQELCEVEVDGTWYRWGGLIDVQSGAFQPGQHWQDIPFTLVKAWARLKDKKHQPIQLTPGKHTIRVALIADPIDPNTGKPIRVISNPVEIEILPEETKKAAPARRKQGVVYEEPKSRPALGARVLTPNKAIQDVLHSLRIGPARQFKTEAEWRARLNSLKEMGGKNFEVLLPQLAYWSANSRRLEDAMLPGAIIEQLGISEHAFAGALWPYLDSDDPKIRKAVRGIICATENASATRPRDFSDYEAVMRGRHQSKKSVPEPLVAYMFELAPGQALMSCMRTYAQQSLDLWKPTLWAEHVVSNVLWKQRCRFLKKHETEPAAMEQVDKMSRRAEWWARLYAAEIMRQHPEFRAAEVVERLAKDENNLVKRAVESFASQKKAEPAWGKAVEDLQLGLAYDGPVRTYDAGETVKLRLFIRNVGDKAVTFSDASPPIGLVPTVFRSGQQLFFRRHSAGDINSEQRFTTIKPGETIEIGRPMVVLDARPVPWPAPRDPVPRGYLGAGIYRVSQTYRLWDVPKATSSGILKSGELKLTVGPKDPGRIAWGKAVDRLQLGVMFDEPVREYRGGETVKLKLFIRNTYEKPAKIAFHIPQNFYAGSTLVDAEGMTIPMVGVMWREISRAGETKRTIAPGEISELGPKQVLLLTGRWGAPDPVPAGDYKLSQSFGFRNLAKSVVVSLPTTMLTTGELPIKLTGTVPVVTLDLESDPRTGIVAITMDGEKLPGHTAEAVYAALSEKVKELDEQAIIHIHKHQWAPARYEQKVREVCGSEKRRVYHKGTILPDVPRGKAVEGLQVRVHADKLLWQAGETPTLKGEFHNGGERDLLVLAEVAAAEVELDGTWYRSVKRADKPKLTRFPSTQGYGDLPFKLDANWRSNEGGKPLELRTGKQTIRIAFTAQRTGTDTGKAIRAISNPVEIEILPAGAKQTHPVPEKPK